MDRYTRRAPMAIVHTRWFVVHGPRNRAGLAAITTQANPGGQCRVSHEWMCGGLRKGCVQARGTASALEQFNRALRSCTGRPVAQYRNKPPRP